MIRIRRPERVPSRLDVEGARATRTLCDAMDADPTAWRAFKFEQAIYAHDTVREALLVAQHRKCAFCEQRISAANYGDVEHFRPKGAWQSKRGSSVHSPGYYWLAYAWSNLLISCRECNGRQHKGNLFPLEDESGRARSHRDDLESERPMFVDPAGEEPSDFVRFRRHMSYAPRDNPRGVATIRDLGLDRLPLREARRDWYAKLRTLADIAQTAEGARLRARARASLVRCAQAATVFSAMARDFLVAVGGIEAMGAPRRSTSSGTGVEP